MEEPGERCFCSLAASMLVCRCFWRIYFSTRIFRSKKTASMYFCRMQILPAFNYNGLCIPLPPDCAGKALRIVTYGPSLNGLRVPVFPSHGKPFFRCRGADHRRVWCMTAVTVRLMLALSLLLVLVLGAQAGQPLWKLLPLSGYFLSAAVSGVCNTFLESASGLNADSGLLNWVYLIHMDFCTFTWQPNFGAKTLGLGCHNPAAYSAYCLAEFCGGAASHRKSR